MLIIGNKVDDKKMIEFLEIVEKQGALILAVGARFAGEELRVFEKSLAEATIRLIDVRVAKLPPPAPPGSEDLCRVFVLSEAGRGRLREHRQKAIIDGKLSS